MGRLVITFSRNVFLPVTTICRNRCGYCGFRKDVDDREAYLLSPDEVEGTLIKGSASSEALFTFGEHPDIFPAVRERLKDLGYSSFLDYVISLNKLALSLGKLPHTNPGIVSYQELKRLRRTNVSLGLMLETTAEVDAHVSSPGKVPALRIEMIENAGKLKIPFTTGILVGIGESETDRDASLKVIKDIHDEYGHIQEVIIQNFSPKPGTEMAGAASPRPEVTLKTVSLSRKVLGDDIPIQVPPNLSSSLRPLVESGASDLGGISSITPDFINPEHPWPTLDELKMTLSDCIFKERLPIYPKYVLDRWYHKDLKSILKRYVDKDGYRIKDHT